MRYTRLLKLAAIYRSAFDFDFDFELPGAGLTDEELEGYAGFDPEERQAELDRISSLAEQAFDEGAEIAPPELENEVSKYLAKYRNENAEEDIPSIEHLRIDPDGMLLIK